MKTTGIVRDKIETLPYANIYFSDATGKKTTGGTASDLQGYYSLEGNGTHITASFTGYKPQTKPAAPVLNFTLERDTFTLPEVVISAKMVWPRVLAAVIIGLVAYLLYKKYAK